MLLGAAVAAVVTASGPLWWAAALGLVEAVTVGWQRVEGTRAAAEVFVPVRRSLMVRAHEHGDAVTDHHPPADLLTRATLDSEAETFQGRVVVAVTHRMTSAQAANAVTLMLDGAIVASGHHDKLVRTDAAYQRLWAV